MSLQGPILIVTDRPAESLAQAFAGAGAEGASVRNDLEGREVILRESRVLDQLPRDGRHSAGARDPLALDQL